MGLLALNLPVIGQQSATEDQKTRDALAAIQTVVNGNLDQTNIVDRAVTANKLEFGYRFGYVVSTGTIGVPGSGGWTVSRTALGSYTVTFTAAFVGVPVCLVTPGTTAGAIGVRLVSVAAGTFAALTFTTNTAAAADADFSFVAMGRTV